MSNYEELRIFDDGPGPRPSLPKWFMIGLLLINIVQIILVFLFIYLIYRVYIVFTETMIESQRDLVQASEFISVMQQQVLKVAELLNITMTKSLVDMEMAIQFMGNMQQQVGNITEVTVPLFQELYACAKSVCAH